MRRSGIPGARARCPLAQLRWGRWRLEARRQTVSASWLPYAQPPLANTRPSERLGRGARIGFHSNRSSSVWLFTTKATRGNCARSKAQEGVIRWCAFSNLKFSARQFRPSPVRRNDGPDNPPCAGSRRAEDGGRRLDIDDDRVIRVDQIVGRVRKERLPTMGAGLARCRVGR
jgi:hypothetical protein